MAATRKEVLKANIVLVGVGLLGTQESLDAFSGSVDSDIVPAGAGLITNVPAGTLEPGYALSLNRERITLELSPSRSAINRDYPSGKNDLCTLAEIAGLAIESTSPDTARAVGYNIELIYDQDSGTPASQYLAQRLFNADLISSDTWRLVGGAGRIIFDENGHSWRISIEPRFNDETSSRVFLSLNLHIGKDHLPEEREIEQYLRSAWDQAHNFADLLDARSS